MIKIIPYRDKSILLKNDKVFILKESKNSSDGKLDTSIKIDRTYKCASIDEAIDQIDKDYFDKYDLPTVVYQVIINPGDKDEHTEELTDMYLAQELFDGLKIDPDPSYKLIKFVKYDYDQDSEEILDFFDFSDKKETTTEALSAKGAVVNDTNDYRVLEFLSKIINSLKESYDSFNDKPDNDTLKYELRLSQKSIEQLINYI